MFSAEVFETKSAKLIIAVVAVLLLAAFQVAVQAQPAHASTNLTVKILGAGKVDETTSANKMHCTSPSTTPTGVLGNTCTATGYGDLWGVTLQATPSTGYTFSQWQDGGNGPTITCSGASSPVYTSPTCSFTTPFSPFSTTSVQTEAVFVDTQAPPPPSISGPTAPVKDFANFSFGAISDPTFQQIQCWVVGKTSPTNCTFGTSIDVRGTNYPDGTYTLAAQSRDYSGNLSGTTTRTFTVDKTLPETTLDPTVGPTPDTATQDNDPSFAFTSNEGGTFECNLQGPGLTSTLFSTCSSPKAYTNLKDGNYTFSVRAKDTAGNVDSTPATRTWTILNAPTVTSNTPLKGATGVSRTTDVVANFSEAMAPTSITNSTTHVSKTFTLKKWNAKRKVWKAVPATVILSNSDQTATLDPYGATEGSTEKALAARTKFKATITTGATDASGNPLAKTVSWTFTTGRR